MGRVYTIPLNIGSHTAILDIAEILAHADKPFRLIALELGQTTELGDAQEEVLPVIVKRVTGAPTSGTGGSTPTAQPVDAHAVAFSGTVEVGNTTVLSGGTSNELARIPWNVRGGTLWTPPPEIWWTFSGGTRLVLTEAVAPADALTGPVGWIAVEELL